MALPLIQDSFSFRFDYDQEIFHHEYAPLTSFTPIPSAEIPEPPSDPTVHQDTFFNIEHQTPYSDQSFDEDMNDVDPDDSSETGFGDEVYESLVSLEIRDLVENNIFDESAWVGWFQFCAALSNGGRKPVDNFVPILIWRENVYRHQFDMGLIDMEDLSGRYITYREVDTSSAEFGAPSPSSSQIPDRPRSSSRTPKPIYLPSSLRTLNDTHEISMDAEPNPNEDPPWSRLLQPNVYQHEIGECPSDTSYLIVDLSAMPCASAMISHLPTLGTKSPSKIRAIREIRETTYLPLTISEEISDIMIHLGRRDGHNSRTCTFV